LKQECETLRGQIVHSPEQLKQKIEDLTKTVETTKADIAADEKKISQVQLKLEEMKKAEQVIYCIKQRLISTLGYTKMSCNIERM